jgi:glutamyl-tRNA synthetase
VGNARTALFNWLFARKHKGCFVLRVEDTDVERSSREYLDNLLSALKWLGLDWDEGPDKGGSFDPYLQSRRLDIYRRYTRRLLKEGKAYRCFCSSDQLEAEKQKAVEEGRMPLYSGACRGLSLEESERRISAGERAAVRLVTPGKGSIEFDDIVRGRLSFDLGLLGDPVLVRSSGVPAYNYAVVIDDALMQITHVIRGEDHISNMPRQLLTYEALSFSPPRFAHLSMVMGRDNTRLSKRHGATSLDQFERNGILPEALFNYLALLGWAPPEGKEVLSRQELVSLFNLSKVSRHSAIFDYEKLNWVNRQHLRRLPAESLAKMVFPDLKQAQILPSAMSKAQWAWLEKAADVLTDKIDNLSDFPGELEKLFIFSPQSLTAESKAILESECGRRVLLVFRDKLERIQDLDFQTYVKITDEIKQETGCKGKDLYHPLRLALTTRESGLDLDKFIPLVEEGSSLAFPRELKNCRQRISDMLDSLALTD